MSLLIVVIVVCFLMSLLALWAAVQAIERHLDRSVQVLRTQRNEDLRWHRESLLAHLRLERAYASRTGSKG